MLSVSLQRLGLLVAQVTADSLARGFHNIVDYFHVPHVNGSAFERIEGDHLHEGRRHNDPPPAYFDIFENPCFVSTEYKDDRAAVNLIKTASHASALAHAKRCECKPCRDRRPTFHKRGTGRRYGYQGTPTRTRTAAVGLAALSQSASAHETPSRNIIRMSQDSESQDGETPLQSPAQESRLRGGDLDIWRAVCDRFSDLEVERPQHDAGNEQDRREDGGEHEADDLDETWTCNHASLPPIEWATLHIKEPWTTHPLGQLATAFDGQNDNNDSDLDDDSNSDLDDNDFEDVNNIILPASGHLHLAPTRRTPRPISKQHLPSPWPFELSYHHRKPFQPFHRHRYCYCCRHLGPQVQQRDAGGRDEDDPNEQQ
jgi:hypothetical protein